MVGKTSILMPWLARQLFEGWKTDAKAAMENQMTQSVTVDAYE
jgi:hypothetical protein